MATLFIPIDLPVGTVVPHATNSGGTASQTNLPIEAQVAQPVGAASAGTGNPAGLAAAPVVQDPAPDLQHVFTANDGTQVPLFSSPSPSGQTDVAPPAAVAENGLADLTHLYSSIGDDWFF